MIIGIISDIHGYLSPKTANALRGSDYILCAGDCETPLVLNELEAIAPTITVLGNCDHNRPFGPSVKPKVSPLLGGVRFVMVHRFEDLGALPEDTQVVVYGHTHVPRNEKRGGILYVNPGSPTKPRNNSRKSVMRITILNGNVTSVELVELN